MYKRKIQTVSIFLLLRITEMESFLLIQQAMYKTRNTGTGNGIRRTQGIGGNLYSGERSQTFRGILPNIPGNVLKYFWECRQTFWRKSKNIPRNFLKCSGECPQTCRGIPPNIPGNVAKYSRECFQTFRGILPNISGITLKYSLLLTSIADKGQAFKVNGRQLKHGVEFY